MKKMDLKNIPNLLLDLEPQGNNNSNAYVSFYQKKLYEIKAFNDNPLINNKPINILYDNLFFGRINLKNESIIINQETLKTKKIQDKEIKLINFALDAYTDFTSYWLLLKKQNRINTGGFFYTFQETNSWIDPGRLYYYYMSGFFDQLKLQIKAKNIKINSFTDFINQFVDLVDIITPVAPISFSSFVRSRMALPSISGLCIDVNALDLTNDSVKYSAVLKDPNYVFFKKTAAKYGFVPDKHIPWRLYADIDSQEMKTYMSRYDLTQENLYNTNYVLADSYDLELLRFYLVQFYNTYIAGNSIIKENEFKICETYNTLLIKTKEKQLTPINLEGTKFSLVFERLIMKFYIYIKARENNYSWDQSRFDNTVDKFIQIKEALDISKAMSYIRPLTLYPAETQHTQRNFKFTRG